MRNFLLRCVPVGLLLLALGASPALAQTFTGGLRGSVSDPGGIVPGVSVTLINEGTQVSRETITNASGEYNFSAVQPATYTIRASLTGFKTYERKGVRIATQQFLTLDITLEVGPAAGNDYGHRRRAADRDIERVDRRHAGSPGPGVAARPRPQCVHD